PSDPAQLHRGPGGPRGRSGRGRTGLRSPRIDPGGRGHQHRVQPAVPAGRAELPGFGLRTIVLHPPLQTRRDDRSGNARRRRSRRRVSLPADADQVRRLRSSTRREHLMHIGLIGLGRMGGSMRDRIRLKGLQVIGSDQTPQVSDVASIPELVDSLEGEHRVVWVMVPAGEITESVITELAGLLSPGDVIIDGGNSKFTDDLRREKELADRGLGYVDAGVSGGVWGETNGYGLMVGGDEAAIEYLMPLFDALRPDGRRHEGFVRAGEAGAGHVAQAVHNGIESGLRQAAAEGYEILAARDDLIGDVSSVFEAWQRGTVVRSWLLELLVKALNQDPDLDDIRGFVADSGEGRWTVEEAIQRAVPAPVISAALFARFDSRQEDSPAMKAVAALRQQFGGHATKPAQ